VPLPSLVAVPVVWPWPLRNVVVPLLSVVAVPVVRPLASRNVVWFCADAAVIVASVSDYVDRLHRSSPLGLVLAFIHYFIPGAAAGTDRPPVAAYGMLQGKDRQLSDIWLKPVS
jgi:hypothetical protein